MGAGTLIEGFEDTYGDYFSSYAINIDLEDTTDSAYIDNTDSDGIPVVSGGDTSAIEETIASVIFTYYDMNPAHIIYECLTDSVWGMGYDADDLDEDTFTSAADTMYDENMGISLFWNSSSTIEEFIQEIIRHIDGSLYVDRNSGLFVLKLIRDDYEEDDLITLDESNIVEVKSYSRVDPSDTVNRVTVSYWDSATDSTSTLSADDQGLMQTVGYIVESTVTYSGFTNSGIAAKVALRNLRSLAAPLLSTTIEATREASSLNIGDVFKFEWPDYHDSYVVMRVVSMALGSPDSNKVKLECVEDVYYLPENNEIVSEESGWTEIGGDAEVPDYQLIREATYKELVDELGETDAGVLMSTSPEAGYIMTAAVAPDNGLNAKVWLDSGLGYEEAIYLDFTPYGILSEAIGKMDTTVNLSSFENLDLLSTDKIAQIGSELVRIDSIDETNSQVTIGRGVFDTVPADHSAGDYILFYNQYRETDGTEYVSGETIDAKFLTRATGGTLDIDDAVESSITLDSRAYRPFAPGNFQVDGEYFPETLDDLSSLTISWAHRDRTQQTSGTLYDFTEGDIGPETGQTYSLEVYADDVLDADEAGLTGNSYTYVASSEAEEPWEPDELSTLKLWLDASDTDTITEATGVSQWADKSGNEYHLTQSTASAQPSYTSGEYVEFDGTDDNLSIASRLGLAANPDISIVAVLDVIATVVDADGIASLGGGGTYTLQACSGTSGWSWRHNNGAEVYDSVTTGTDTLVAFTTSEGGTVRDSQFYRSGEEVNGDFARESDLLTKRHN